MRDNAVEITHHAFRNRRDFREFKELQEQMAKTELQVLQVPREFKVLQEQMVRMA